MTIRDGNERVLTSISEYLCFTPEAIRPEDIAAMGVDGCISRNEAYIRLLAAKCGLGAEVFRRDWLSQMVQEETPEKYLGDAYLQLVKPREGRCGSVDLVYETLRPMELYIRDDFRRDGEGRILPQLGWISGEFAFPAIREDGRVWMTVTPNEINTIQPLVRRSHGRVLAYGLGLGYYALHCLLRKQVSSVTVVEKNPQVIRAFRRLILPFFPRQEALHIIEADAFAYTGTIAPQGGYDTVFTDLWYDVEDGIPLYRRMKALEYAGPDYLYWMEPTLRCYMD